jgi:hypothetical protein
VKQSDQQELSDEIAWEEARENEDNFFANTEPWRSLPKDLKSRVGTDSLTRALGGKLFDLICKRYDLDLRLRAVCLALRIPPLRLPGLLNEVKIRVQETKLEIAKLPITPTNDRGSLATLMSLIEGFKKDVQNLVKGRPEDGYDGLVQTFRESRGRFREAISRQAPEFQVFDRPKQENFSVPGHSESIHVTGSERVVYMDEVVQYAERQV